MHPCVEGRDSFEFPLGSFLQIWGIVKEEELCRLDMNGEECFIVIKDGKTTRVAFGRGTGIKSESFVWGYADYGIRSTSMEVVIYPYSHKDCAFSTPSDSGSIVIDGHGHIIGLLAHGTMPPDAAIGGANAGYNLFLTINRRSRFIMVPSGFVLFLSWLKTSS